MARGGGAPARHTPQRGVTAATARRHEGGGTVERKRGMGWEEMGRGGGIYKGEGEEGEGVAGLIAT
uniref:Uncharacterized protein n=1 Tax=Oryza sativa subsp. japonica TaxID=39947 RepID=Q6AVT0_ORYSJ|nr:hypothetical protein [Oryza sativa Japonica Group]